MFMELPFGVGFFLFVVLFLMFQVNGSVALNNMNVFQNSDLMRMDELLELGVHQGLHRLLASALLV